MWVAVERDSLLVQKQLRPRREAETIIRKKEERRASIDFIIPPRCAVPRFFGIPAKILKD